jgi:hypothetical protein
MRLFINEYTLGGNMEDLKYVIVPGQWPQAEMRNLYQEVYRCWESTWSEAYRELGKPAGYLKSDAFTRQDVVGGIFKGTRCIALNFFRWVDPTLPTTASDSYFANWGETHIQKLRAKGDKIIVCSHFTIAPEARGLATGIPMKDLLVGMGCRTFVGLGAETMTGALRRDRHVNEACARWGGTELAREIPSGHGDTVDLMAFYKEVVSNYPRQAMSDLVDRLWDNRLHISVDRDVVERWAA